jgi:hypothetical protein
MNTEQNNSSLLYLLPYDDESISHYLGRWYRQEVVSTDSYTLGKKLRLGKTLWRWENFYFNPPPNQEELEKMNELMGLEAEELILMFPPRSEPIKLEPIRLCAACYSEAPYHRMNWQFQSIDRCKKHRLRLLSKCPSCQEQFAIPSLWVKGECQRCHMPFRNMAKKQKPY